MGPAAAGLWLGLVVGAAGCLPEGAPPWLVDHAIVASIRFDVIEAGPYSPASPRDDRAIASLMPGDRVRATPFLVGPDGPIDPEVVEPAWFYCRTTRCYGDLTAAEGPRACDVEAVGSTSSCALGRAGTAELELGELRSLVDLFLDPPALLMVAGTPGGTSTAACVQRLRELDERGETLQRCILLMEPLPLGPLWRLMVLAGFAGLPDALPLVAITPEVQAAEPALYPAVLPFELTITGVDGVVRERIAIDGASVEVARGEHVEIHAPVDVFDAQIYYQALLGSEFRPFDPYQSNYLLEASGSYFIGTTEVAGVLSHISRHLGDRPKRLAVAENSLGPRVMHRFGTESAVWFDVRADVRKVIARAYDDYTWIEELELVARRQVNPHAAVYLRGYGQLIQVDPTLAGRTTQKGGRVEAGVKLRGANPAGPAMELFAGGEQMIDADVLDRLPRRWAYVGFRILGK